MRKATFRRLSACLLSVVLLFTLAITASAATIVPTAINDNASEVDPCADEQGWYYRINNGYYEKRLWSYTYGKWLTDWIVVGPVE